MTESPPAGQRSSVFDHPLGFWFFFWGEFAERCSYYGMRAVLWMYMTERLGFVEGDAHRAMSLFIAGCYVLPLLGGFIADNYLGKYRTIVFFSIPYIVGQAMLGVENRWFLFFSLCLLAMGSGVIKPNISTLMGLTYDAQRPGRKKLRSDAFAMFYGAINIGAAISSFAMPALRNYYSYQTAFFAAAGLMALAMLLFAAGKPFYAVETIRRQPLTPAERQERWIVLRRIFGLFLVVTFFWSIFDQSASTWTQFARDDLDLTLWGFALTPDQIQGLNPILILILLPPITLLWHLLADMGIKLRPTDKMLVGFVLTAITMGLMAWAGYRAEQYGKVTVLWEAVAYVLITVAEICISVVGLELAFSAAPATMKSFVTACWLLTVFFANMLNSVITPFYGEEIEWLGVTLSPGNYFAMFALLMIPVTIAFILVARRFNQSAPA